MTLTRRLALGAAFCAVLSACGRAPAPHKFNALDISGLGYAQQFSLPDFDGHVRTLADFKGKVAAVFFGYTQCPDACPTTLAALSAVAKALGPDAARFQVIFVTVDPARDTPTLLKNYVTNFNPGFIALRGDDAQTRQVAREFKVFYQKVPGRTPDAPYTMDHTAGTYVFDPSGHVRLFVRENADPAAITADVRALLAGS